MKISVVIPFYNGEKFCKKIFEKINQQTYTNYEIICIDDGSNDNTLQILKKIALYNEKIRVYHQNNTGPGYARRLGYTKSNGELIWFVDSDDEIYDKYTFQNIINIFQKNNPDVIFYNLIITNMGKKHTSYVIEDFNHGEGLYDIRVLDDYIFKTNLCNKIFKLKMLDESMFYNGKNFEDAYTLLKYLDKCSNFYYTTQNFYINDETINPNSLTKTINTDKIIQVVEVLTAICQNNNFSTLKSYKCFDMYCYQFKNIYENKRKWNKQEIKQAKKELKKLRPLIKSRALNISLKYFSFKRYILYIISLLYI